YGVGSHVNPTSGKSKFTREVGAGQRGSRTGEQADPVHMIPYSRLPVFLLAFFRFVWDDSFLSTESALLSSLVVQSDQVCRGQRPQRASILLSVEGFMPPDKSPSHTLGPLLQRARRGAKPPRPRSALLGVEALENRTVFAGSVKLSQGILSITG